MKKERNFDTLRAALLGDGYLSNRKNCKSGRFAIEHSVNQRDFLVFKATQINKELGTSNKIHTRSNRPMCTY